MQSTLRFLVNGEKIILLTPINYPKIVAYNIENRGHVEEADFVLSFAQLNQFSKCKISDCRAYGQECNHSRRIF